MDFDYSPKVQDLQARLTAFMEEHIYPAEAVYHAEVEANRRTGNAWVATRVMEELKAKARAAGLPVREDFGDFWRRRPVEPVSTRIPAWRRADQPGIRAAVRDHGPLLDRSGSLQLQRAGYRQHGDAGALRH